MQSVHPLTLSATYGDLELSVTPVLLELADGLALVDVGPPGIVDDLARVIAATGHELADVRLVVITHHDGDHIGGLAALCDRVDPIVCAHAAEIPFVEGERQPLKARTSIDPARVDLGVPDGTTIHTRAGPARIVETPGHSPGHCSVYLPEARLLIAGDALVADGDDPINGPKEEYTPDMSRAFESVRRLGDLAVERTVCYHGGPTEAGTDAIRSIVDG